MAENAECRTPNTERPTAEILRILQNWGVRTLGQLAALDKEELRDRLGPAAVRLWERANGTATRLLKFVQPPETFIESFEFDHEIETAEPLLFILRRFLEQLALRLGSIYLVAHELTLTIHFSNSRTVRHGTDSSNWRDEPAGTGKGNYERVFKIPQPTNDVDLLFRMLQTHLESFKSEHPIVAVALSAQPSRPVSQQFGLFETALRNPQQFYETLARLSALVGNDRVGTPVLEETHRPDAFRMEVFDWQVPVVAEMPVRLGLSPANENGRLGAIAPTYVSGQRPPLQNKPALRRFRPPANTSVFVSQGRYLAEAGDWGQSPLPRDKVRGQIVDQIGPFLLSGNWWDEKAWARAEYDMQLENGEIVRAHELDGKWALDGLYD
ncbi:MAG TPA: hypothetical protein VLK27_01575 [Chthoniobacterales bacterium]|nr:hypothetical protein [Chthoniobacterales bacterium]